MHGRTRHHGASRARFYGCSGYHERGQTVCANRADVSMADADATVLEALPRDVLTPQLLDEAVDEALALLQGAVVRRAPRGARAGTRDGSARASSPPVAT